MLNTQKSINLAQSPSIERIIFASVSFLVIGQLLAKSVNRFSTASMILVLLAMSLHAQANPNNVSSNATAQIALPIPGATPEAPPTVDWTAIATTETLVSSLTSPFNREVQVTIQTNRGVVVGFVLIPAKAVKQNTILKIQQTDLGLLNNVYTENIVSPVVDLTLLTFNSQGEFSSTQPLSPIQVCMFINATVSQQKQCLAYIDTSVSPPVWNCEDQCLTQVSPSFYCGTTSHLTNFCVLLNGQQSSNVFEYGNCGGNSQNYIFGSWWKEGILAICVAAFIVGVLLALSLLIIFFPPANRVFMGKDYRRRAILRNRRRRATLESQSRFRSELSQKPLSPPQRQAEPQPLPVSL